MLHCSPPQKHHSELYFTLAPAFSGASRAAELGTRAALVATDAGNDLKDHYLLFWNGVYIALVASLLLVVMACNGLQHPPT